MPRLTFPPQHVTFPFETGRGVNVNPRQSAVCCPIIVVIMKYPIINKMNNGRLRELLIAQDYVGKKFGEGFNIMLGNDDTGIPDAFVFNQDKELVACIELVGYTLNKINETQSHREIKPLHFEIDIEKCTDIHMRQPHPFTLIINPTANYLTPRLSHIGFFYD